MSSPNGPIIEDPKKQKERIELISQEVERNEQNSKMNWFSVILGVVWFIITVLIVVGVGEYNKTHSKTKLKAIILGGLIILVLTGGFGGGIYGLQINKE
jgi:peptidoglycan/LPS O-acetylase OafA/YrhL